MKKIFILFIFTLLTAGYTKGQTVYSCNYKYDADVKVYVTDYKYDADLVVYKCSYKYGDSSSRINVKSQKRGCK